MVFCVEISVFILLICSWIDWESALLNCEYNFSRDCKSILSFDFKEVTFKDEIYFFFSSICIVKFLVSRDAELEIVLSWSAANFFIEMALCILTNKLFKYIVFCSHEKLFVEFTFLITFEIATESAERMRSSIYLEDGKEI